MTNLGLPHWSIAEALPAPDDADYGLKFRHFQRAIQENFEHLESQTTKLVNDALVHPSVEALGEVTTTSASYVELSGGPEITVATRPGLMVAVLLDSARMTC